MTHTEADVSGALCSSILVVSGPPVAWSGTGGSQGVSLLSFSGPRTTLLPILWLPTTLCVFVCQWTKQQAPQDVL